MKYIFVHEKKDAMTEKSDGIKNSKKKKKLSAKKWCSVKFLMNLFIYKQKI